MNYTNKNTGESISQTVYNQLTSEGKSSFVCNGSNSNDNSKSMSIGDGLVVAAAMPLVMLKWLFD